MVFLDNMLSQLNDNENSLDNSIYAEGLRNESRVHEAVKSLTEAWTNERHAPELLRYRRNFVETLIEAVEHQTELVMDAMASNVENKFMSLIYQTEMERVKYLLKSYLRTRLHKIEKYTLELLRRPDYDLIMSPQEIVYARRYQELTETHNHESFLHLLPHSQHKQDEKFGDLDMVVSSNLDAPVFCRVQDNIGQVELDRSSSVPFEKDDIYILRYRDIKQYLEEGRVQLV